MEAWIIFLSNDDPEVMVKLMEEYPEFRKMYEEIYDMCLNTEKVMNMWSKELLELDKNTVQYMIDEMQDEIDAQKVQLQEKDTQLQEKDTQLQEMDTQLQEKHTQLQEMDKLLVEQKAE